MQFINETFEYYSQQPQINWSKLKKILISPKNYKYEIEPDLDEAEKMSKAMVFGSLVHTLLLDDEMKKVISYPPDKKEQNEIKKYIQKTYHTDLTTFPQMSAFLSKKDVLLVSEKDACEAKKVAEVVKTNPKAVEIIEKCAKEVSAYTDSFKARFDLFQDEGYIADIKTTTNVSPIVFAKSVINIGYHTQAAFYLLIANKIAQCEWFKKFYWIAIETTGLHCIVYDAVNFLDLGYREVTKALNLLEYCQKTDQWQGYDEFQILDLPYWLKKRSDGVESEV